jgi:ABC-2 type transport system ATP-binding protein
VVCSSASSTDSAGGDGMAAADCAIETRRLTKRYAETVAVDRLNLRIGRGEVFGLLGPNGAGKTTTILMLLGLTEPTDGVALVDGLVPQQDALEVKRRIGYLPDDVGFYDDLTGRQNLRYTARLNRMTDADAEARIEANLAEVGLTDVADRKVKSYSRGMRQRLGLADALLKDPSILILDEPTVNIDPEGVREILSLVRRLSDERGVTVLLSSHLLHQVEQVCDRIGIFLKGRLVAQGTLEKLAATVEDRWVIEVGVDRTPSNLADIVDAVPGVNAVDREGPIVVVTADHDVRPAVVDALADAGLRPVHLRRRGADLDAIYHRYFLGSTDVDG